MARVSDVRTSQMPSSRDSSPDPLELPTSPLGRHSPVKRQGSIKRSPSPRKVGRPRITATPTKSVILDTPGAGDASPWRIKVTVEAEPREGSPGKRITRTTTVPLKDETSKRSSSPTKRGSPRKGTPAEPKRRGRKRKGTPIRDPRPPPPPPAERKFYPEEEDAPQQRSHSPKRRKVTPDEEDAPEQRSHSPARRASGRLARLSGTPGSARSKRLSYAREELDAALQAAVGMSDDVPRCDPPGDKTVSMNEDFSMISVDFLQATKEHGLSNSMRSTMRSVPDGEKSAATVSYMASSPPKPQYPDLSSKAEMARSRLGQSVVTPYDVLKGSGIGSGRHVPSSAIKSSSMSQQSRKSINEEKWQRERDSVSRKIQSAPQEEVVVVDEAQDEDKEHEEMMDEKDRLAEDFGDEDDLWQTEASREVEASMRDSRRSQQEPMHVPDQPQEREPQLEDLFADQPLKPPRPKIQRTWRRSSGNDFEYVDSPAHQPVVENVAHVEERRDSPDGSGVLTPPETESEGEEVEQVDDVRPAEDEEEEDEESDFEPDAEATRMHGSDMVQREAQALDSQLGREDQGMSDDGLGSDHEEKRDTFATNMPQVHSMLEAPKRRGRPPRQPSMNLTELLNLDGTNSPIKPTVTGSRPTRASGSRLQAGSSSSQKKPSPAQARRVDSAINNSSSLAESSSKSISSPLRKSLLRSTQVHGDSSAAGKKALRPELSPGMPAKLGKPRSGFFKKDREADVADSFEGKTSDQQQLLQEARAISRTHLQYIQDYAREYSNSQEMEVSDAEQNQRPTDNGKQRHLQQEEEEDEDSDESEEEETDAHEPSKSYEEHLNLDSPGKVKVNFNDSRTSSLLAPTRHYPPLFDQSPPLPRPITQTQQLNQQDCSQARTAGAEKPATANTTSAKTGIFSRLTSTFWSAITHPVAPVIDPQPQAARNAKDESLDINFPPSLRAQLRERYGVVHDRFPWTMHHMRTLHRMLNSITSGRPDTLVPKSGRLPGSIARHVNTTFLSVTGYDFFFTKAMAYVVWSFFQLRMPAYIIERMEKGEIEWLGDSMSKKCRGYYDSRHGSEELFKEETHGKQVAEWVEKHQGIIGVDFVVRALGVCVKSNEEHGGP